MNLKHDTSISEESSKKKSKLFCEKSLSQKKKVKNLKKLLNILADDPFPGNKKKREKKFPKNVKF